jgi:hypothetical protein
MSGHLSSEEMSEYILGYPRPTVARHIRDCAACHTELAQFREALGDFRGAVRGWSENQAAAVTTPASVFVARSWSASRQLAWALAIAAVCVVASFVLPHHAPDNPASDVVLLNQVDAQVSRTVPASMEPLMQLVVQQQ